MTDHLESGRRRFAEADWAGARDAFAAAVDADGDDADALDGLGQALWWLGRREAGIQRRREAYAAYRRRGDDLGAARVATYLAGEHRIDGQEAAAAGWLARARRLLGSREAVAERGTLAVEDAKRAGDPLAAEGHARVALEIAHALDDADLECTALAQLGRAAVAQGRVQDGLALLDEAMTVALGGESSDPMACGDAACTTLVVCHRIADLRRATEWSEAVVAFAERRHFTPLQSWCRAIHASVLLRAGAWADAESVLSQALAGEPGHRSKGGRVLPLVVLADLRLRQGRPEEAGSLLQGLEDHPDALAPLVDLHLATGDVAMARAVLGRRAGGDAVVLSLLGAAVAQAAADADGVAAGAGEMRALAESLDRDDLRAHAARLTGAAASLRGDLPAATSALEEAVRGFAAVGLPFEEGRARLALARALIDAGSPLGLQAARSACDALERIGARRDADEAAALLRGLGAAGRTAPRGERGALTGREREVLGLIAAGLSNGEIAERLVIAPKTAEHHVSRVLAKLGVRSRAEAAAHAVRDGL